MLLHYLDGAACRAHDVDPVTRRGGNRGLAMSHSAAHELASYVIHLDHTLGVLHHKVVAGKGSHKRASGHDVDTREHILVHGEHHVVALGVAVLRPEPVALSHEASLPPSAAATATFRAEASG